MKKFIKHIVCLGLITIGIMVISDHVYSYVFRHGIARSKIQYSLQRSDQHYDYIFLGSSRTENHIDCELIERLTGKSCANFGISGGSLGDMLILMKVLTSQNVTYDKVFVQVDYSYNHSGVSPNTKARLIPYINNSIVKKELAKDTQNIFYNYVPFYRYMAFDQVIGMREFLASVINAKPSIDYKDGFKPKFGTGLGRAGSFPKKLNDSNPELEELKNLVVEHGATLNYFIAPYCKYVKNRSFVKLLENRIPEIHNYSNLYDDREEFFFNCGHLNLKGAENLTKQIIKDYHLDSNY